MAVDGKVHSTDPAGHVSYGVGSDGREYPFVVDPATGRPIVTSATSDTAPNTIERTTAAAAREYSMQEFQQLVLLELRLISRLLAVGLNVADDVEQMRSDEMGGVGPVS